MDRRHLSLMVVAAVLAACSHDDPNSSLWESACRPLLAGKYEACYGPGWEAMKPRDRLHYSFYEVEVVKPQSDGSQRVLFSKRLASTDVAPSLLTQEKTDVVRFDETKRTVTFAVGHEPVSFTIE
jgi:hypothetical protein